MGTAGTADTGRLPYSVGSVATGLETNWQGSETGCRLCLCTSSCRRRRSHPRGRTAQSRSAATSGSQDSQLWSRRFSCRRGCALPTFYLGERLSTRAQFGPGATNREPSARTNVFPADQSSAKLLHFALSRLGQLTVIGTFPIF